MAMLESTARFGAAEVKVGTCQSGDAPRLVAFCAPVQLGECDLVAALWLATSNGVAVEELADDVNVRAWVADAIVNSGLSEIEDAYFEVGGLAPGADGYAWLQEIRAAVRRAFAPVLVSAGRALVGVA